MKKFLSLVLALVMTMSLVTVSAGAKDFTDSSKITYSEAVDVMSAVKVIDGYAEGDFRPTATLTRGAAAKIICNLILGPTTASALVADAAPYKDVPTNHTFAGYIAYCQKEGIISGYADGTFRPANSLTGYAFMKMLLGALGYDAEVEGYTGPNWSVNVAKRALNIGLDDGLVGDFNGVKAVNREEACLYALNTLTADMVEYDAKTTVSTNGTTVVIAGSKAKEMVNNGNSQKVQSGAASPVTQTAEHTRITLGQTTVNTLQDNSPRPAAGIGGAMLTTASVRGGIQTVQQHTPNARYTQRPPKQPTGQASPPRAESPHPGTAGMQSAVSAQRPSGEPRPGRNGIPSRTAVSPDARQHSPIRQESRSASAAAAPTLKGTAPNRHPDPAGTAAGVPSASQSRQTVRPSAPSAKSSAQPGKKAVSTTAALKGSVKADGDVKPSRKQRGKKHG